MTPTECRHRDTIRGLDMPLRHGTWRSQVCLDCKHYRVVDHFDKPKGEWKPIAHYRHDTSTTHT